MRSGLTFLIAAKRCETADLQQLVITSDLVQATARMIHALQRERGLSNLYLGSKGTEAAPERVEQLATSLQMEQALRASFERLDTDPLRSANGARLFNRIAYVLHALDALPALRDDIQAKRFDAPHATELYGRLVAGLLAVVFEAADTAADPDISRRLVCLFNFMQGKEFTGQERATGSAMYASGQADQAMQHRMLHLIESQERCLEIFHDFASDAAKTLWAEAQRASPLADLERLRRLLCTAAPGGVLNPAMGPVWFGLCSHRMDDMRVIEEALARDLQQLCTAKMAQALQELGQLEKLEATHPTSPDARDGVLAAVTPPPAEAPTRATASQLDRSILALVQEQSRRLQSVHEELESVRTSLNERKLIERAKGLLMAHRQLTEEEAHKALRQTAMNQNRRLIDVAKAVLTTADVLPTPPR